MAELRRIVTLAPSSPTALFTADGSIVVNQIPNPSFEIDTSSWSALANGTIARSTAQAMFGTASLACTVVGAGGSIPWSGSGAHTVPAGKRVAASCYIYLPASYNAGGFANINDQGQIASKTVVATQTANTALRDQWQRMWVIWQNTGADATFGFSVNTITAAAGNVFYIDGVQVTIIGDTDTTPPAYFDGTTAGAGWRGLAHASISQTPPPGALITTTVLDLNDGATMRTGQGTWRIAPGQTTSIDAVRPRPRGGSRRIDERHANGSVAWSAWIKGASANAAITTAENMFAVLKGARADLYYEWRPDGATNSTFYAIRGAANLTPQYQWAQFLNTFLMQIDVEIPIAPVGIGAKTTTTLPTNIRMPGVVNVGTVGGSAPGLGDVTLSGVSSGSTWGLIGWTRRRGVWNMFPDPGFETGWSTWSTTASWAVQAGTSVAASPGPPGTPSTGTYFLQIVTTATNLSGATTRFYDTFHAGVTYTAEAWVAAGTVGESVNLVMGSSSSDFATSATVALSATYQKLTVTWTPVADTSNVLVGARINDATPVATTILVDDLQVYEGTTPPATNASGGTRPFGVLHSATIGGSGSGPWGSTMTRVTSATAGLAGTAYQGTATGAQTITGSFQYIDPTLLDPDDYTDTVEIEAWISLYLPPGLVSPRATLYYSPEGSGDVTQRIYTSEFGSVGKPLVLPTVGNGNRIYRLGTVAFPRNEPAPVRYLPNVILTWGAGSTGTVGTDYLMLVPTHSRCLTPTGKVGDVTYPSFGTTKKVFGGDLSAYETTTVTARGWVPGPGLGGSLIELPPGNVDMLLCTAVYVPDDPTAQTGGNTIAGSVASSASVDITTRYWLAR